jgi:hypothetical protein
LLGGVITASALLGRNLVSTLAKSATKRTPDRSAKEEREIRSEEFIARLELESAKQESAGSAK